MRPGLREPRVLPTVHRPMFPLTVIRVAALHVPPGRRDELLVFIHGDGIRRHRKRTADGHPVQRLFERRRAALGARRPLLESTRGQYRHARTRRTVAHHRAGVWGGWGWDRPPRR